MSQALTLRFDTLQDLCVARLRDCVDPRTGLLGRRIRDGAWVPAREAESIIGSAAALIGLTRAGIPPEAVVPDPGALCHRLAARVRDRGCPGALGLVLWACGAVRCGGPLRLLQEAGIDPYRLPRLLPGLTTMEVARLASGLLHQDLPALRPAREAALEELEGRLARDRPAFLHASPQAPRQHRLRARIASFADQVHPLQALAFAAIARGDRDRLALAEACGAQLVAAQGPLGQWWWQHDAAAGRVAERYPVYSMHQHSLAPMALRTLAAAGGTDHARAAARSRAWLHANELGIDMVEPATGIIWRSVERAEGPLARRLRQARLLLGRPAGEPRAPRFRLNRDIRPEEWGWLLYASALEHGPAPPGHIA